MQINVQVFEKLFLNALMTDSSFMALVGDRVDDSLFRNKNYAVIAKFYKIFFQKYGKLPNDSEVNLYSTNAAFNECIKTVKNDLEGIDFHQIDNKLFLEQGEQFIKERLAYAAFNKIVDEMAKNPIDPADLVKTFENIASVSMMTERGYNIYSDIDKYVNAAEDDEERIATGFKSIDDNIQGGVPASGRCLGVITAPTNMGKSIMLGNLAVNALKQGKKVLIISLEMSEHVYATRIYADLYNISVNQIPFRKDELKSCVQESQYGSLYIKEFPPASMTVEQIDGYLEQMKKSGLSFDMICIDYLTLLRARGANNSYEAGQMITRGLRALTYKYSIPIWTACQINRAGMQGETLGLEHIAESIAITQEADLILGLYRQEEDADLNNMRLRFLKSRFGKKDFTIILYFDTEHLRFEDRDDTTDSDEIISQQVENSFNLGDIIKT